MPAPIDAPLSQALRIIFKLATVVTRAPLESVRRLISVVAGAAFELARMFGQLGAALRHLFVEKFGFVSCDLAVLTCIAQNRFLESVGVSNVERPLYLAPPRHDGSIRSPVFQL